MARKFRGRTASPWQRPARRRRLSRFFYRNWPLFVFGAAAAILWASGRSPWPIEPVSALREVFVQNAVPQDAAGTRGIIVHRPGQERCHPSYAGRCVPMGRDYDCWEIGGLVTVVGPDVYRLDRDRDGIGCESSRRR